MSKRNIYTVFEYDEEALGKKFYYFNDNRIDIAGLYKTHYEVMLRILIKYIINNRNKINFDSYNDLEEYLRKYSLIMIYYQLNRIPQNDPGFIPYITEVEGLLSNNNLNYDLIMDLFKGFNNFSNSSDKKALFKDLFVKLYLNKDKGFYSVYLNDFKKLLNHINKQALDSFMNMLRKDNKFFTDGKNEYYSIFNKGFKSFDRLITDLIDDREYKYYCIDFTKNGDESDLDDLYANIDSSLIPIDSRSRLMNFMVPVIGACLDYMDEIEERNEYIAIVQAKYLNLAMLRRTKPLSIIKKGVSFIENEKIDNDTNRIIIRPEGVKKAFDFYFSKEKDKEARIHLKLTNKGFKEIG